MDEILKQKSCLRHEGLAKRKQLSSKRREEASLSLMDFVQQTIPQGFVLSYIPFRSELDVRAINLWLAQENRLLLPKMQGNTIVPIEPSFAKIFHLSSPKDVNQMAGNEVGAHLVTTALVPAVVFDQEQFRLGYGGGYYDRFLARYPRIWTVGVGFKEQLIASLPRESHDIPLNTLYLT
ncbi:5-formyltetrahydrofolate cyclo-ligase [Chlamydia muridarum str. Nigg]|jgi:5,10-methenyltetrahydrofolate synthetase|uniref:5-formyltetrahydrofolate cyclo-ligase n=2 Tax=Chlamydia muridarum TaxID=83560 RepID=A0A069ZW06_CHLMR|nr:5-formyltetrahydrofolate cyclo-ligase [Chlamydia muridarum]UFU86872.1 5-formyltetrahydrofolate cyclo-ligase [Chlamydia trachomatis]AAF73519.1 5-formyltetrahydrofolate cyclo-ligase, putative [Chlamydia muridarum str. Nigg]AHH22418.1 5-formyltetrahydrofolate cyclo-ligase [Chlamydia muridarum str. Nigg3 CMUT3-5]AHH23342.1 5-formyltetrahydrofolate cyclo-ligase [Chlamydia muridarum str. Nigg CM972]AID37571.1 5-formyltetrahydrofolate cyclo-ligase [Chlamydia muridarum str. Nigg 2 MCR]